ncbi:MAG: hypothetical protein LBO04_05375 [Spirochaetaceae bacterium]|nr:hypothetical protein [Spirochaetaceae bacterium]
MFDQKIFKETLLERAKEFADAKVIMGPSVVFGNVKVVPVFKDSPGIMGGGDSSGAPRRRAAAGVSVTPVNLMVIENFAVKIIFASGTLMIERFAAAAPTLIDKITVLFSSEDREGEQAKPSPMD